MLRLAVGSVSCRPPLCRDDRAGVVAGGAPLLDQLTTCLSERAGELGASRIDPTLPRRQVHQMHAVEKWTAIEIDRGRAVAALERVGEIVGIRADTTRNGELVRARLHPLAADDLPQLIQALP